VPAATLASPARSASEGTLPCEPARVPGVAAPPFEEVYAEHFPFVWRSVRRLGVDSSAVDDTVQEIFLVVHRRLSEFEARASMKTWLFGIVLRVVRQHRRTLRRKPAQLGGTAAMDPDVELVRDAAARGPHEQMAEREAVRTLHAILDQLDDERREIFVLAELEQMTVPEIADAVEANVNTVYSRLRAARRDFDQAVLRHRARDQRRER
jgi:RNA polymerase sigma-70 factor (ECF subfamily)